MRSHSYLNSAASILQQYDGKLPLAPWMKNFFGAHKKFGSRDRKEIAHICYCYFRLGKAFTHLDIEERMLTAVFLCSDTPALVLRELKPQWEEYVKAPLNEKLSLLEATEEVEKIFPFTSWLSTEIDPQAFSLSMLRQPDLFLRARPGQSDKLSFQLDDAGISFVKEKGEAFRLANQSKIEEWIQLDQDAVVQDLNSQQVLEPLLQHLEKGKGAKVWDCCAASGGKSIQLYDHLPKVQLTVSDIRESILHNLSNRFGRAGISHYRQLVADLTSSTFTLNDRFDAIICDAPCSGSGTWARTPEQLHYFDQECLHHYSELQKKIALRAAAQLKPGGLFLYITCSVFEQENEAVVTHLKQALPWKGVTMRYYKGYDQKADTLFAALLEL